MRRDKNHIKRRMLNMKVDKYRNRERPKKLLMDWVINDM